MILNIRSIYVILYLCNRTESGCDFPIVRCPLVLQRRVMPMNTMEVLTLLLVVLQLYHTLTDMVTIITKEIASPRQSRCYFFSSILLRANQIFTSDLLSK